MAAWWAPLGAGVRRLLGGGEASTGTPTSSTTPAGVPAAPERPPQAWPWQPPVQRAVDPGWAPALRPDDFVGGLASHQDPSLRRDLVHDVRPTAGGLVDGLADLVPGRPGTHAGSGDLPVRPVRHEQATLQRSLAGFATDAWSGAGSSGDPGGEPGAPAPADRLATVELQPPWSVGTETPTAVEAEARATVEASVDLAPAAASPPPGAPSATLPVVARAATGPGPTPSSVPVGPRDVRVQRSAEPATTSPAPRTVTEGPTPGADAVVPTDVLPAELPVVRSLPIAEAPPPRPVPPADLPVAARALPALQRRTLDPSPAALGPAAGTGAAVPRRAAAPGPSSEEAPLSSFADAIQRLAVDEVGAGRTTGLEPEAPELVLPSRPVERTVPGTSAGSTDRGTDVQRLAAESVEQPSDSADAVPTPAPEPPARPTSTPAPLLGAGTVVARTTGPAPSVPAPSDDVAALPVLRPSRPASGAGALDAVPHLAAVASLPAASPSSAGPTTSSSGSIAAAPTVARTPATENGEQHPSPFPFSLPSTVVPTGASTASAPLTGLRTALVQRAGADRSTSVARAVDPVVQPLRFGGPGAQTGWQARTPAAAQPVAPLSRTASVPSSTADVVSSVQRAADVPAVAPGLVGPAPVPTEAGSGSWAPDAGDVHATPVEWSGVGTSSAVPVADVGREPGARAAEGPILQRLPVAAPPVRPSPPVVAPPGGLPVPVRSLPFDAMFGPGAVAAAHAGAAPGASEDGWTSVDLPVLDGPGVQRAVETDQVTAEPAAPPPAPEPPAPAPAAPAPAAPTAAGPAAGAAMPSGADLDEMARRLFDPLSARLRAELWLDRERSGLVVDARL